MSLQSGRHHSLGGLFSDFLCQSLIFECPLIFLFKSTKNRLCSMKKNWGGNFEGGGIECRRPTFQAGMGKFKFFLYFCIFDEYRCSQRYFELIHFCRELNELSNGVVEKYLSFKMLVEKSDFLPFFSKKKCPRIEKALISPLLCISQRTSFR